jgi:hypothetical protein
MNRSLLVLSILVLVLIGVAGAASAQTAPQAPGQQKPEDMKTLMADIAGEYSFEFQGQALLVEFTVLDGKLFGAPPGETPEEIHPVEGKPRCFDVTVSDSGDYYFLEFVRNDKGVIDKCLMTVQGMVVEGTKIVK